MSEDKHYGFKDGMPTRPDVDALLKKWPDLQEGELLTYQQVQAVLREPEGSARYRVVTHAWRKRLREQFGIVLECMRGKGFFVAGAEQISAATYDVIDGIGRKAKRHRAKLMTIRPEDTLMAEKQSHQMRLMLAIEKDAKHHKMNVLPNTTPAEMPRMGPPKLRVAADET
jgi:hypothetical protein